jgi:hypothetical protein
MHGFDFIPALHQDINHNRIYGAVLLRRGGGRCLKCRDGRETVEATLTNVIDTAEVQGRHHFSAEAEQSRIAEE